MRKLRRNKWQIIFGIVVVLMMLGGWASLFTEPGRDLYCWGKTVPGTDWSADPLC